MRIEGEKDFHDVCLVTGLISTGDYHDKKNVP